MSSNTYTQRTADGQCKQYRRSTRQGRRPLGLGKPKLVRLHDETESKLEFIKSKLGYLYNENQIVLEAVRKTVDLIYTELLNT